MAIVVHAAAGALSWYSPPTEAADDVVAQRVTVVHRTPPPRPTPRPTPPPTPRPTPAPTRTTAPAPAAPKAAGAAGLSARAAPTIAPRPTAAAPSTPAVHHVAASNSSATGTGSGTAGSGAGAAGQGSGGGAGGDSGNGAGGATAPCGAVYLSNTKTETRPDGSEVVAVHISVHLRDGKTADDDLHWAFVYPNDNANPFSQAHRANEIPVLLQLPPSGYDLASNQQPWTVFAVQHTRPNGYTDLPACPDDN